MCLCKAGGIFELQQPKGERDELVTLAVRRGDSQATVSRQRGLLAMRLNPMSINPEQNQ
jgi:hypothetical protein|tara:strand:- start:283 stop:459 length:177 start_codon:yes stop_codon:yes gene_type:complete